MSLNNITKEAVETAAISAGNKAAVVGGGGAAVSSFLHSNAGWITGVLIGILGLLVSAYFQQRRDRREEFIFLMQQRESERRMEKMRTAPSPLDGGQQ